MELNILHTYEIKKKIYRSKNILKKVIQIWIAAIKVAYKIMKVYNKNLSQFN